METLWTEHELKTALYAALKITLNSIFGPAGQRRS